MKKEFKISDILNAVNAISKIQRKRSKNIEVKNEFTDKNDVLSLNNQAKSNKSEILVLNQMIE